LQGLFQALRLGAPGDFEDDMGSGCLSAGPGDLLQLDLNILNLLNILSLGNNRWCDNFGGFPCEIKVALYEGSPSILNPTITVKSIASFVITGTDNLTGNLIGHFTTGIDTGPIGTIPGMLYRPVLVQ
jgi:hypothetical protein